MGIDEIVDENPEDQLRYPQPYSIKIPRWLRLNPAAAEDYRMKEHARQKYRARGKYYDLREKQDEKYNESGSR